MRTRALASVAALAALVVGLTGLGVFAELTDAVLDGGALVRIDGSVLDFVSAVRTPEFTDVFMAVTHIGDGLSLLAVSVVGGAALGVRARSVLPPLLLTVSAVGMALAVSGVKLAVARPRPAPDLAAYLEGGYAFPSGHAANTTTVYLTLAVLTAVVVRVLWVRLAAVVTAVFVSAAVGVSRVALGVHSPTDVVAGWLLAVSWVSLVVAAWVLVPNLVSRRPRRSRPQPARS